MRRITPTKREFIEEPRRAALLAMTDLKFTDGEAAFLSGAGKAFPRVSHAGGVSSREYSWDVLDKLVKLGVAFPA